MHAINAGVIWNRNGEKKCVSHVPIILPISKNTRQQMTRAQYFFSMGFWKSTFFRVNLLISIKPVPFSRINGHSDSPNSLSRIKCFVADSNWIVWFIQNVCQASIKVFHLPLCYGINYRPKFQIEITIVFCFTFV